MMLEPLRSKRPSKQEIASVQTVPAPIKGWNTRDPLANMRPDYALVLDNWFPKSGAIGLRGGALSWATRSATTFKSVAAWRGATGEKLFGIANNGIFDISAGGAIGAAVQSRTNGYSMSVNFNTTGGSFLVIVNGTDDLVYTNGTTWTSLATFTIGAGPSTIATNLLWNVNTYKRALYFIKKDSMSFFYLPIDQITGAVQEFPLGALFSKGGKLVAMGNWTIDGGVGQEDYSVFITSEGQCAVYLGTDPSSATTWALKGVYNVAPPMGRKCFCTLGGDLLVLTARGVFSLTKILREGKADESGAISAAIGEAFTEISNLTSQFEGWEILEYPSESALIVNIPLGDYTSAQQFVMNTETFAWCRFLGWSTFGYCFYKKEFYGALTDKVGKFFVKSSTDFGASITANVKTAFNYYSPRSRIKSWRMLRPNLTIGGVVAVNMALDTDFGDTANFGAAVFSQLATSRWDVSAWDTAQWSAESGVRSEWLTVAADDSYCAATRLRVISREATVEWSATDTMYEIGSTL